LGLARITDELKHQAMAFKALLAEGAARGDATARVMVEELVKLMQEVKDGMTYVLQLHLQMQKKYIQEGLIFGKVQMEGLHLLN
jgi:hypothetical protein